MLGGSGINALGHVATNRFDQDINDDTRVSIDVTSLYLQDEIELTDHFRLVAGLRYDSFDIDVLNMVADDVRSRKDSEVSPRLGLVYKPIEVSRFTQLQRIVPPRSGEQFANINGNNDKLAPIPSATGRWALSTTSNQG